MGFNNGYDAGWQDAINAVKYGKVAGLGPVSGGAAADTSAADTPAAAFNAGVLEGYDVEKLLSTTDLNTYLDGLTNAELIALVSSEEDQLGAEWNYVDPPTNSRVKLGAIMHAVLSELSSRNLISIGE